MKYVQTIASRAISICTLIWWWSGRREFFLDNSKALYFIFVKKNMNFRPTLCPVDCRQLGEEMTRNSLPLFARVDCVSMLTGDSLDPLRFSVAMFVILHFVYVWGGANEME